MELKHYLSLVWRWAWLLVLGTIVAGSTAFGVSRLMVPVYEASTTLLINQASPSSAASDYNSLLASERLARTYAELLRKRPILATVIANLELGTTPETLAKQVQVPVVRDTQLIVLTVKDINPQRAADIANEIVRVFSEQKRELQARRYGASKQNLERELARVQADVDRTQASLSALGGVGTPEQLAEQTRLQALLAQYRTSYTNLVDSFEQVRLAETQTTESLDVVEAAQPDIRPVSPRVLRNTLLAGIVAALLLIGLIFGMEYLNDTIKSSEAVADLVGAPLVAAVPRIKRSQTPDKLAAGPASAVSEAYRLMRVNIERYATHRTIHTIVVASAAPLEGKSTTAVNLAAAFAQTGKRVILVDADLRRPSLHHFFDQTNERGLTTALLAIHNARGEAEQSDHSPRASAPHQQETISHYLVPTGIDNVRLLPSGPLPPYPAELLGSRHMRELIAALKAQADIVLFDSPAVLAFVDATVLARACDTAVLVARARSTRLDALRRAKEQIVASGAQLAGVALNGIALPRGGYYRHYASHKAQRQPAGRGRDKPRLTFLHRRSPGSAARPVEAREALERIVTSDEQSLAAIHSRNGNGHRSYEDFTEAHGPLPANETSISAG